MYQQNLVNVKSKEIQKNKDDHKRKHSEALDSLPEQFGDTIPGVYQVQSRSPHSW